MMKNPNQVLSSSKIFLVSLFAKFIATIFTYPVFTLKTKEFTNEKGASTLKILKDFIKNEGVFALYRGIYAKLFQTLLYNAFMMMTFEKIKAAVQSRIN